MIPQHIVGKTRDISEHMDLSWFVFPLRTGSVIWFPSLHYGSHGRNGKGWPAPGTKLYCKPCSASPRTLASLLQVSFLTLVFNISLFHLCTFCTGALTTSTCANTSTLRVEKRLGWGLKPTKETLAILAWFGKTTPGRNPCGEENPLRPLHERWKRVRWASVNIGWGWPKNNQMDAFLRSRSDTGFPCIMHLLRLQGLPSLVRESCNNLTISVARYRYTYTILQRSFKQWGAKAGDCTLAMQAMEFPCQVSGGYLWATRQGEIWCQWSQ